TLLLRSCTMSLFTIFFLLLRPPPTSTLFPYTDALPIFRDVLLRQVDAVEDLGLLVDRRLGGVEVLGAVVRVVQLAGAEADDVARSEEHTSELQSRENLVCRLLLEKKKYI